MRKVFCSILITIFAFTLYSCSNDIEKNAEIQMKKTMEELAKNPESLKISNIEVAYKSDSLCILNFIAKGQNGFGGYSSSHNEYIYMITKDGGAREALYDLDDNKSVIRKAKERYDKLKRKNPDDTSVTFDNMVSICSITNLFILGRYVKK